MSIALTDEEKASIRHHMGYVNVDAVQTFVLGSPAALETTFLIEGAMNRVLPAAAGLLRRYVAILDNIESQMVDDLELLAVEAIDEIKINKKEQDMLVTEYLKWVGSIEDILGVPRNPFSKRFASAGVNVPVQH